MLVFGWYIEINCYLRQNIWQNCEQVWIRSPQKHWGHFNSIWVEKCVKRLTVQASLSGCSHFVIRPCKFTQECHANDCQQMQERSWISTYMFMTKQEIFRSRGHKLLLRPLTELSPTSVVNYENTRMTVWQRLDGDACLNSPFNTLLV